MVDNIDHPGHPDYKLCHKKSRCVPATLANAVSLMDAERSINLFQLTQLRLETLAPKRNILYIGSKIL